MSDLTLNQLVFETGDKDAAAVVSPALSNSTLSRTQLKQISLEAAHGIQAHRKHDAIGIEGQSVVAMALPNGLPFVLAFLGVTARGAIAAPLNPAYTVPEFEFYLSDTKAGVLVVDEPNAKESFPGIVAARKLGIPVCSLDVHVKESEGAGTVSPSVKLIVQAGEEAAKTQSNGVLGANSDATISSPTPDTLCLILHTSGTTGKPKAVPLSHANIACSAVNVASSYGLGAEDRGYLIQVLFHIHGIVASLLAPLVSGGSVVVPNRFDAGSTWIEFSALKCSWLSGTPSALQILLHAPKAGPALGIKFLRSCSSPLLPSTFQALQEAFQCPVLEAYAMTENAHQMTTNIPSDAQPGSVGKAAGTVRLAIYSDDDTALSPLPPNTEGEVCITGPSVTRGYLENPEANKKAFFKDADGVRWFRTGDIGLLDNGDHLRIVGRRSEIINRGGEKISPLEVDEAIMLCAAPHIREAACFAVPDEFFHQEVEAAIVLAEDAPSNLREEAEIQRLLEQRLAAFKIPKRIHFFDGKIPKGPTGKIQRVQLSKKLARSSGSGNTEEPKLNFIGDLPERIRQVIAAALRVDLTCVTPETTLLELGADSMNLTRMLGNLRQLGCSIDMSDVILNPSVQQVIDICINSTSLSGPGSAALAGNNAQEIHVPAPFSVLKDVLDEMEGGPSVDVVLEEVARQTGLELDQIEEVLPLTPEEQHYLDITVTDKYKLLGSHVSWVTVGSAIKSTVDIERLKWAFTEVAKVEPLPRSFVTHIPGTSQWLRTIAKPGVLSIDWQELSAPSEKAAIDMLQANHESLRYRPGTRASKLLLIHYPNEAGEMCRDLYCVDSHAMTDNTSRAMLRDNVVKVYLGEATIENLPQAPIPQSVWTKALIRITKENYTSKMRYWQNDIKSHGTSRTPAYCAPPEAGVKLFTQFCINEDASQKRHMWTGDIKGLTVLMGMTAPTLIQAIMPLAVAAFEYQYTREIPKSIVYNFFLSARSGIIPPIPRNEQLRGFGIGMTPFNFTTSLAEQSLWLHMQTASLKLNDLTQHYHVEAAHNVHPGTLNFVWRELPSGSEWSNVIEDKVERFSAEFLGSTLIVGMRVNVDTVMLLDGETEEYIRWRGENGFPVGVVVVLQRCLTFLCENKDKVVDLTLHDMIKAVWDE